MLDNNTAPDGEYLVFNRCSSVHTFGMRENLNIAFLDTGGIVIRTEEEVKPRRVLYCQRAKTVVECRSAQCRQWLQIGDQLQIGE